MKWLIFTLMVAVILGCGAIGVYVVDGREPAVKSFLIFSAGLPMILVLVGFAAWLFIAFLLAVAEGMAEVIEKRHGRRVEKDLIASMTDLRDKMKRGDLIPTVRVERCCGDSFCSRCHGKGFIRSDGYLNDWQSDDA